MADNSPYTDSIGLFKIDPISEDAMAEAMGRILNYGVPFDVYADAFQGAYGPRGADDCAVILGSIIKAAVWGAMNARDILTVRQIEETEDENMGGMQG